MAEGSGGLMAGLIHDGAFGFTGDGDRGGVAGAKAVAGARFRVEGGSGGAALNHNRRTARLRTSRENCFAFSWLIAPPSQVLEPQAIPARFTLNF